MTAYYNENDPGMAAWLELLILEGHIASGHVDRRSIEEVTPNDISGYTQCHFFAGLGGWSHALRLAGWSDDRPVWTGSCPCQPFSQAGRGLGTADERHLWPVWRNLIAERRPSAIFGEQVASPAALAWLSVVQDDLEGFGYAIAPFDLPAAGAGAPHIRQRILFVADTDNARLEGRRERQCKRTPELSAWSCGVAVRGRDGKQRFVEPGAFPLADGVSARVGLLRGYGNAIVAPLIAEFIKAYDDAVNA